MNLRGHPFLRSMLLKGTSVYWRTRERYVHNYVFIHINKNGGRSIERALGCNYVHKTAQQKVRELGRERWDRKFTFSFVRNPWDRAVSQYAYRFQTGQDGLQADGLSFEDWVRRQFRDRQLAPAARPLMFLPQHRWLEDEQGEVLVDFIGRFERFEEDFAYVCEQIGRDVALPHHNRSERADYRTYYTDETAAIIADYFAGDVERYDYQF